jgi:hypothetical protein
MTEPIDKAVLNAIAVLRPTASLRAIQDQIASRGLPAPSQGEILDAIERLEVLKLVRPRVEVDNESRFAKRFVYYDTVEGRVMAPIGGWNI